MSAMRLLSVNIGRPEHIPGHTAPTGIVKRPVSGPVEIGPLGLPGDAVMDTKNHGGFDQAVYLYGQPDYDWWAIPKGTPKLDAAYKFVGWSSQAGPQADQTNYISYGPANKDATAKISAEVLKDLPTAPDNMGNVLVQDQQFWADNGEQLRERFNAWLLS